MPTHYSNPTLKYNAVTFAMAVFKALQCSALKNPMQCTFQKSVHKKAVLGVAAARYTQREDLRPEGELEADIIYIVFAKNVKSKK